MKHRTVIYNFCYYLLKGVPVAFGLIFETPVEIRTGVDKMIETKYVFAMHQVRLDRDGFLFLVVLNGVINDNISFPAVLNAQCMTPNAPNVDVIFSID